MRPLSIDLRQRIADALDAEEGSQTLIAERFQRLTSDGDGEREGEREREREGDGDGEREGEGEGGGETRGRWRWRNDRLPTSRETGAFHARDNITTDG